METKDKHTNILTDMPNTKKDHVFTKTGEKFYWRVHTSDLHISCTWFPLDDGPERSKIVQDNNVMQ
jgi:hypothetical protein